jgi:hypothetical protein
MGQTTGASLGCIIHLQLGEKKDKKRDKKKGDKWDSDRRQPVPYQAPSTAVQAARSALFQSRHACFAGCLHRRVCQCQQVSLPL